MKFIYKIASGSLNSFTKEYWFNDSYFTSLKKAEYEITRILKINEAENIKEVRTPSKRFVPCSGITIAKINYDGEQGRYKALIILTKLEIR